MLFLECHMYFWEMRFTEIVFSDPNVDTVGMC